MMFQFLIYFLFLLQSFYSTKDVSVLNSLIQACQKNDVQQVKKLLIFSKLCPNFKFNDLTPLMIASSKGHEEIVKALLKAKANVNEVDKKGQNALHYATFYGHMKVAELLVREGKINVNQMAQNRAGTPLYTAAAAGHANMIEFLASHGAEIEPFCTTGGFTPLHIASARGHHEAVVALLKVGANASISAGSYPRLTPIRVVNLKANASTYRGIIEDLTKNQYVEKK